jgi:hypothetical protein
MTAGVGYALEAKAGGNAPDKLTWGRSPERASSKYQWKSPKTPEVLRAGGMRRESER